MYNRLLQPDPERWNAFICRHPRAHFLQTAPWGDIKAGFGWEAQRVALADADGTLVAGAQILYRPLPLGLGKLAYVPFGPVVDWDDADLVRAIFLTMDKTAKRNGAGFMKLEPGFDVKTDLLQSLGCHASTHTIQPPRTIVLDIRRRDADGNPITIDEIQSRMNQMTRRNIRKSQKYDVDVREGTRADVDSFNRILQLTAERNDFGVHVPAYYEKVYDCLATRDSDPQAALIMASYTDEESGETKDLAGVFVFKCGSRAWYIYGASSREERKRMASYGAQWAAVEWARRKGATTYDLYGIPDESEHYLEEHFQERKDGLWGVYFFKRGWGGDAQRTVGAWDRVYNPMIYWAYRTYLFFRGPEDED